MSAIFGLESLLVYRKLHTTKAGTMNAEKVKSKSPKRYGLVRMASNIQVRVNPWKIYFCLLGFNEREMNPDLVLNDRIAFGKFDNTTLKYLRKNITQLYYYYLTSNKGSCSSQVQNFFEHNLCCLTLIRYIFRLWKETFIIQRLISYVEQKLII